MTPLVLVYRPIRLRARTHVEKRVLRLEGVVFPLVQIGVCVAQPAPGRTVGPRFEMYRFGVPAMDATRFFHLRPLIRGQMSAFKLVFVIR